MVFKETLYSLTVGLGFLVGYLILAILLRGSQWRVAHSDISGQFGSLPRPRRIDGQLYVSIGLQQVDITLTGRIENDSNSPVTYQESFVWLDDKAMAHHLRQGLRRGLPYPVLTVLEHLAVQQDHVWGWKFVFSGRLVTLLLWLGFSGGLVSALLGFLGEARPLAVCLGITGSFLMLAVTTHDLLTPPAKVVIHFAKGQLTFTHGWCYTLLLYLGVLSIVLSVVSMTASHLERLTDILMPVVSFVQKLDHFYQKHNAGLKTTA